MRRSRSTVLVTACLALGAGLAPVHAQDRARVKEVVVAFAAEPRSLLPDTSVDWTTDNQVEHMYDRLVDRDPKSTGVRLGPDPRCALVTAFGLWGLLASRRRHEPAAQASVGSGPPPSVDRGR
jgi:ABC-type oligopeptide transport system substrate-binding subunit